MSRSLGPPETAWKRSPVQPKLAEIRPPRVGTTHVVDLTLNPIWLLNGSGRRDREVRTANTSAARARSLGRCRLRALALAGLHEGLRNLHLGLLFLSLLRAEELQGCLAAAGTRKGKKAETKQRPTSPRRMLHQVSSTV